MVYDALEMVKLRNNFYRDGYRKVIFIALLELFVIVGLVTAIMFLAAREPKPTYFAATDSGRIIPLIALDQPNLSDAALIQWASVAVTDVNTYDFVNFRKNFQDSKRYFTDAGWRGFMNALTASKNLQAVQEKKLVVSAVLQGAPVITNRYILDGRFTWEIQMPVLVTYQGGNEKIDQRAIVVLKIRRISTLDSVYGVGIAEYVAKPL